MDSFQVGIYRDEVYFNNQFKNTKKEQAINARFRRCKRQCIRLLETIVIHLQAMLLIIDIDFPSVLSVASSDRIPYRHPRTDNLEFPGLETLPVFLRADTEHNVHPEHTVYLPVGVRHAQGNHHLISRTTSLALCTGLWRLWSSTWRSICYSMPSACCSPCS